MPYTLEEIKARITPVAEKYRLASVYLFGSYARGDATAASDVDLLVDLSGSIIRGLNFVLLYDDLKEVLGLPVDLVTMDSLVVPTQRRGQLRFRETVNRERRMIYAAA
jgi:predicted nucleotidyltransferase